MGKRIIIDENKDALVNNFLSDFLPKRNNQRKNSGNELYYVHSTLSNIFFQNFGFSITKEQLFGYFDSLGYNSFMLKGTKDIEKKEIRPSVDGDLFSGDSFYMKFKACFIFIDISASTIRILRKTRMKLSKKRVRKNSMK